MAGALGQSQDPVSAPQALAETPERFTLFAALRALERAHPRLPRLGESRRLADDPVRVSQPPHLLFAPSEVASARQEEGLWNIEQYLFGVFGPNGALPRHLTELANTRARHQNDPSIRDFINAFQHRFTELFYRAWAEASPAISADRPAEDRFAAQLGALAGIDPQAPADAVGRNAKLGRTGLFGLSSKPAAALERALSDFFGLEVRLIPFVGQWLRIPADERCRLGKASASAVLGGGAVLGERSWQRQQHFEICIGPLDHDTFKQFLPGGRALDQLAALVRFFTNDEWSWQLRLELRQPDLPAAQLGRTGQLGWQSWLGTQGARGDTVILAGDRIESAKRAR